MKCSILDMSRDENEKNNISDLIDPLLFQSSSSNTLSVFFSYMDNFLSYSLGGYYMSSLVKGNYVKRYKEYNPESETWSGLIGLLIKGNVEMLISDLTTTLEREEPVRERSLFKLMEVLKSEVWVSILGALILTAFLLWFLEKYSVFSARNNLEKYNEPVRVFDLKNNPFGLQQPHLHLLEEVRVCLLNNQGRRYNHITGILTITNPSRKKISDGKVSKPRLKENALLIEIRDHFSTQRISSSSNQTQK
ncbi:GRIN [Lepeophtheirus salmonis]|uniref:GRIN n=1 Tax=Lepeophtheirus salmonis TaxID=72036 RepID=A0A7R8HFJ7_LEPSM|nr:GRIN [Lepeophtheirus salmonis]CAF3045730.1 GRIN [Lepeophtheirus salmonis]